MGVERRDSRTRWVWVVAVVVAAVVIDGVALLGLPHQVLVRMDVADPAPRATSAATAGPTTGPSIDPAAAEVRRVQADLLAEQPRCFGAAAIARRAAACASTSGRVTPDPATVGRDFESFPACYSRPRESGLKVCDLGSTPGTPRVLVLGDSHARVLLGAFQRLAKHGALSVSAAVKASCAWSTLPLAGDRRTERATRCAQWRENLTGWLRKHARDFDLVVTTAYAGRMVGTSREKVDAVVEAWRPVVEAGVPVVALRDNPSWPDDPNSCLLKEGAEGAANCRVPRDAGLATFDPHERAVARVDGTHYVDLTRYFCDDEACPAVIGGVDVYRNDNHVSATYAASLAPWILEELAERDLLG